jgi:ABC-type phosphate transport system substrate-binding protein
VIARIARVLAAVGVMTAIAVWPGSARAQDASGPAVELTGAGSGSVFGLMDAWKVPLYTSKSGMNLGFFDRGDKDGRLEFAQGDVDFAVSAEPLSDSDNQSLASRNIHAIVAPIAVSAASFIVGIPNSSNGFAEQKPPLTDDDPLPPPTPLSGPFKVSPGLLASIFVTNDPTYPTWLDGTFASNNGITAAVIPGGNAAPVIESNPSASDWYLELYFKSQASAVWSAEAQFHQLDPSVQSEDWPFQPAFARSGQESVASLIGDAIISASPNATAIRPGGNVGAIAPWAATEQIQREVAAKAPSFLYTLQIPNAAGDWVSPTTASISAAAAAAASADADPALYAMTHAVPGAYPLTWLSNIMVPDSGLSPDKATALATFMRYAVGPGLDASQAIGEGQLPPQLGAKTLSAADEMLRDNCDAAKGKVVTVADGGPFWPTGVAPPASSLICQSTAASTTPTTTTGTETVGGTGVDTGALGSSDGSGSSLGPVTPTDNPSGTAEVASAQTPTAPSSTGATGGTARKPAYETTVVAQLPMSPPSDGRGTLDRLTTMLLGGLAFLLVRAGLRRFNGSTP